MLGPFWRGTEAVTGRDPTDLSWSKSAFKVCRPFSGCGFSDSVFLNINSTIHQNFLARLEDFKKFEEKVLSGRKS